MVDMIALCPCGSHDRGIGDGRTMVTHNSTCQTCRHTDDDQMLCSGYDGSGSRIGKYAGYNRDQDTEGSPAGAGSKSQEARYQEDDRGKHIGQSRRCALHQTCHIDIRT